MNRVERTGARRIVVEMKRFCEVEENVLPAGAAKPIRKGERAASDVNEPCDGNYLIWFAFFCFSEPLIQNAGEIFRHVPEGEAHALFRFEERNRGVGLEKFRIGVNLDGDIGALGKWIGQLHIAAVHAQVADSRRGAGVFFFIDDFGHGDEWKSRFAASFGAH